jgi:autotransporter-associated beta strand protein
MTGSQAVQLMVDWDKAMDAINSLMGFPLDRGKETMYCQVDVIMRSSVHAPGYPAVNVTSNVNSEVSPAGYVNNYLVRGPGASPTAANIEFHEQGHAYFFPKFGGETESAVNLLQPAMLHRKFGYSIDVAHAGSLGSSSVHRTLDNTAVAWMCCFSFSPQRDTDGRGGKGLPAQGPRQVSRHRPTVRLGRPRHLLALVHGGRCQRHFLCEYRRRLLLRLSRSVGKDIRPLFHFWGIHPQNPSALAAAIAAENIPASPEIRDLLLRYRTLVPANNAAYRTFMLNWWGRKPTVAGYWEETDHAMQWDETLDADNPAWASVRPDITIGSMYIEAVAAEIRARVDELVGGWISTPTWQQTGLTPGSYSYRVKARNSLNTENYWSPVESVSLTSAGDFSPPSPDPMTFAAPPAAEDWETISMTATAATDANGVEYYFENTTLGTNSGWQDSPAYTETGLAPGTTYNYTVKARDKSPALNETTASAPASATPPIPDFTPPSPDPMTFASPPSPLDPTSITMTATTATDPGGVEYFFECTAGGGPDSGWQSATVFTPTGLIPSTTYTYTVRARDAAFNETTASEPASATTLNAPRNLFSAGAKTWNTTTANWGTVTGGPYDTATWSSGDSATFQGTAGTVTLGEPIHIKTLSLTNLSTTNKYTIAGSTLNFAPGGSIATASTNSSNYTDFAFITSAITGAPNVVHGFSGANNQLVFAPSSGSVALGTLGGSGVTRLAGSTTGNSLVGTSSTGAKIKVSSGTWTLTGEAYAYEHWIEGGNLIISTGTLRHEKRAINLIGGTLHYNNPAAVRAGASTGGDGAFRLRGGSIDNTSGAAITNSTWNPGMNWEANWTFIGSNGADSSLFLGNGNVVLTGTRQVTVQNAATTVAVGGVISGGHGLTKAGPGTLELRGANSYTGATTVNAGTLLITGATQSTNAITFGTGGTGVLGLNTSVSVAAASAAVNLTDGEIQILGSTGDPSYTLLTAASITGTPVLASPVPGYELQLAAGNTELRLVQTGADSPFETWAGAGVAFDADANNDGVDNGMAWVLGAADPSANALPLLPTMDNTSDPDFFIFTYRRDDDATTDSNTTIRTEYGSDLSAWTEATPGTDIIITPSDDFYAAGIDKVEVKIRRTLAVGGRLFARLNVLNTP